MGSLISAMLAPFDEEACAENVENTRSTDDPPHCLHATGAAFPLSTRSSKRVSQSTH